MNFKTLTLLLICFTCFSLSAQQYIRVDKAVASDRDPLDLFGHSIDASGNHVIAGAYIEDHDENGNNPISEAGSAYIYAKDNAGNWIQSQKIVSHDRDYDDRFGWSVAINQNWAVVGSLLEDDDENGSNYVHDAGSVYIFKKNSLGIWEQHQKIVASDRESGDYYGAAVSIWGNYIAVGAYLEDEDENQSNAVAQAGSVYLYEKDNQDNWTEIQKIISPHRSVDDLFGFSVSLYNDRLVIGSHLEDHDQNGSQQRKNAGAAYVFKRNSNGIWNLEQKLIATDRSPYDEFGYDVDIYNDKIIIGAYEEDENVSGGNTQSGAGSAYIFELNAQNQWIESQKIIGTHRTPDDHFGCSVSIGENHCVVGAYEEDYDASGNVLLSDAGAAFVYERDAAGSWNLIEKIVAFDRGLHDNFGFSVCIDKNHVVVGAEKEDEDLNASNSLTNSGSAYIFEYPSFVGINENQSPLEVYAYPTPFNDVLYISASEFKQELYVKLYNMIGEEVFNKKFEAISELKLDLPHLHAGIYIVQLISGNSISTARIIKANN